MGLLDGTTQESYYNGSDYGNYQFISLADLVTNFTIGYVGEGKIIPKVKQTDVLFHAKRCIQEFSFDTLPSTKAIEIEPGAALTFKLPQDYVNYVKLSYVDEAGYENIIYPTRHSSNPDAYLQDANYDYTFSAGNVNKAAQSDTLTNFKASTNVDVSEQGLTDADLFDLYRYGNRYGSQPENMQTNGVFYIDQIAGVIRFSSNIASKTVTLKYISDGLGTDAEMQVHKFAEDAVYKYIVHAILNTRANVPEYQIARYKKELTAAKRNAKLRLSNLKISELAQVMRNQSKWIKH
jgi:hypothetical protein